MTKETGKVGRPSKKDLTANMDGILQDMQQGRRLEKFCVDNLIMEKNVRHEALWGEHNYNPYEIGFYDAEDIQKLFASMDENQKAGLPLCDTPPTVWVNEDGQPVVQVGKSRSVTMKTYFPGAIEQFIVVEQPMTEEQKVAENTIRSTQSDMNIAISSLRMKQSGSSIRVIANRIGKKEGWVSKWLDIAEHCTPAIQAHIHTGRIKDTVASSFINDLRLQEMLCEWLDKDSSMVIDSPVRIHTMLQELKTVADAAYLLPFIEKKYGTLLNINQIQDLFYVKQDGIYTEIYVTGTDWQYNMFVLKEVQEPQIRMAGVEGRIHEVGTISTILENFRVEPYTESHWKNSVGAPCFYQYQLVALIADKVSIVAAKAEKVKVTTIPTEMVLKEMRGRYVDEYLSKEDEQSIDNVVHTVCNIHGFRSMEQLELIYELLKRKQRSLDIRQLKRLFKSDFDEAYASAEQSCRDKAGSVEAKEMSKVDLMIQAYCSLYYVKYVAYDKRKKRDDSFTCHINWQDVEVVKSTLEAQSYDDMKRHAIERMIEKHAKALGVQCKFSNKASIKEFKDVQNAMDKLFSLYPEQIKLAVADASMSYSEYLAKKESETSMLENCENDCYTVEGVIAQCKIVDYVVVLPEVQLEASLYKKVAKKLEGIGGKWNKKKGGFVFFGYHTAELLAKLQGGADINLKKEYQYFPTPDSLARELVQMADIEDEHHVGEPSAGQGAILKQIVTFSEENNYEPAFTAIELMPRNAEILRSLGICEVLEIDFLTYTGTFDRIVANPPFASNQDIDHVLHMYKCLAPGGRLVSCMSNHWRKSENKKEVSFQEWFEEVEGMVYEIPAETFKESGTNIAACYVIIDKPHE